MAKLRNSTKERIFIFNKPHKRPYGAEIEFQLPRNMHIGDTEIFKSCASPVSILFNTGAIANLSLADFNFDENYLRYKLSVEGFASSKEAADNGQQASYAVLCAAISLNSGLRLIYSGNEPSRIFTRDQRGGFMASCDPSMGLGLEIFVNQLQSSFSIPFKGTRVFLSMELFCASSIELTQRTAFLTAVSAFEPLVQPQEMQAQVKGFVDRCILDLKKNVEIDKDLKKSVAARMSLIKKESINQSLQSLVSSYFPKYPKARKVIRQLYDIRSELIHEGTLSNSDIDLSDETCKARNLLRHIYSQILSIKLFSPLEEITDL